ncbi:hypothetical protein ACFX1S_009467 [Malus domestica]
MQSFNPNQSHDDDYNIVVLVENTGFPDDQSLPKFPQISISWEVYNSYHVTGTNRSIQDRVATQKFDIHSLPSQDIISNMLGNIQISFPLERLRWKTRRGVKHTEPLNGIDDMIGNICCSVNRMLVAGLRKKLGVIVKVEKQISITIQQYDTMNERIYLEESIKGFHSMLSRSGLLQQPGDGVRGHVSITVDILNRRSAEMYWNEIKSRAAAAGLINDINNGNANSRDNTGLLDVNALLVEISTLMEAVSGDYQSSESRPKPASKVFVEALDKFIKIDGVDCGTNSEFCVVCLEKMMSGEEVTPLSCSHMFHANCVVQWFKSGHTCPVCRFICPTD